jgi:hypothetical protein
MELQQEKSVNYCSVTEGKFIIFLKEKTGSVLYFYAYNQSRIVHYGSEQEKGIAPGEGSALMLCKRRREIHYSPAIGKRKSIRVL